MVNDIAKMQAAAKDIRHNISASLPRPAAAAANKPKPD